MIGFSKNHNTKSADMSGVGDSLTVPSCPPVRLWKNSQNSFGRANLNPQIFTRMFGGKDIPLFRQGDMRVNLRGVDGTVSQHFLNITDVDIRFQETGGKGVTEHVGRDVQMDGSKRSVLLNHSAHGLIGKRSFVLIDKKMIAGVDFIMESVIVFMQNAAHIGIHDLEAAFLRSFAENQDAVFVQIDVLEGE